MNRRRRRLVRYEVAPERVDRSLDDFILYEINPLLEEGWAVQDVRIARDDPGCSLWVELIEHRA